MAQHTLVKFDTEEQFLEYAVSEFKTLSDQAIKKQGRFSVVLSGGNTPKLFFRSLAEAQINWSQIHLYWGDERYVSYSDPESNFGMVQKNLISRTQILPSHIHPIPTHYADPHEAAKKYEELIKNVQLDLVYLGIGSDGHTASLFPGISLPSNILVGALYMPRLGIYRISMMPDLLNQASEIRFLVSGEGKKKIVDYVTHVPEMPLRYPCQRIRACTLLAYGV